MIYQGTKTKNISFPLGGIGTGCIGLSGNGELVDWEIFNRPNKSTRNGYSHFAIKASCKEKTVTKVLHGDTNESLLGAYEPNAKYAGIGFGPRSNSMAGFPHFKNVSFEGEFPMATLIFSEEGFPGVIRLSAFNPFIPHNELDSSLPVAMFEWQIENTADEEIEYALSFTVQNPNECSENKICQTDEYTGLFYRNAGKAQNEIGYDKSLELSDKIITEIGDHYNLIVDLEWIIDKLKDEKYDRKEIYYND